MTLLKPEERGLLAVVTLVVLFTLSHTVAVFLLSRRKRPAQLPGNDNLHFVFVLPCLNEEVVIARSLDSLLALKGGNFSVLVIDDGSDDRTAEVVESFDPARVWLLRREPPNARRGKGEALNAGYRYLRDSGVLGGRRHEDVVVAILDADGRISPDVLDEVAPYFADHHAGAVQIGVRMYNAGENLLTRLQDFEFVTFTDIFQRARQQIGSVGLGGNGQFTRLAALVSLGDAPWTDCLTEDLDLGIRLLAQGWANNFCPWTHVSQQAVTSPRRLIRQRSRWFQGHLQCWKRIPLVIYSPLSDKAMLDLLYHLTMPGLVLALSLPMAAFFLGLLELTVSSPKGALATLTARGGLMMAGWYLLSFGLAPLYGFVYARREHSLGFAKATALAHIYNLYTYLWFAAGWIAVWRIVTRRKGWAKTARTPEGGASSTVGSHVADAAPDSPPRRLFSFVMTVGVFALLASAAVARWRRAQAARRPSR
jgi:1,2-diacylglycerol 3-beta-glucosyltransferase